MSAAIIQNSRLLTVVAALFLAIPYSIIAGVFVDLSFYILIPINTLTFYLLLGNLYLLKSPWYRLIYILINLLQLTLLIYNAETKNLFMTGVDWGNFHRYALEALDSHSLIDLYNNSFDLFVFFIALIYKIFGPYIEQIYFYIFPLSLILFRYVYKTVLLLSENKVAAVCAGIVVLVWPINLVFSVSVLRELPIQVIVVISFYNFIKFLKYKRGGNLFYAFLFSIAAALMHSGMIGIFAVYLYVWLQDKMTKEYKFFKITALIIAGLCIAAFSLTPMWANVTKQFSGVDSVDDVTKALEIRSEALIANTNYISDTPQTLSELLLSAPYRFIMFAFSPFVWQVFSIGTLVAFLIDGIVQFGLIMIILLIIKNRKKLLILERNVMVILTLCIFLTYLLFSFGTNNYGTAMRHRTKVMPLAIVLVSTYYFSKRESFKVRRIKEGTING